MFRLRSMAYLAVKAKGNNSMPLKRETPEDAYGRIVPRDLRDMAKAKLLESQYSAMKVSSLVYRIYTTRPSVYLSSSFRTQGKTLDRWAVVNEPLKGMDGMPKSRSFPMCKRGIAYGARALWQRSLRSSPRTGKPSTWRRGAGVLDAKIRRYA